MKSYEQYKRIIRFFSSAILLCAQMALYRYIWINYYNGLMEVPYNRTGHWLMVAVYGILLIIFSRLFGGVKIGYMTPSNIINLTWNWRLRPGRMDASRSSTCT